MSESSSLQLQAAHIAALRADAALQGFVGNRVFDYLPETTLYPFIAYHIHESPSWDTSTDNGDEHLVYVHVYSSKEGAKEARKIMQRVYELMHDVTTYTLVDHTLVNCRRTNNSMDRDGQVYHGIGMYRAVTEEK